MLIVSGADTVQVAAAAVEVQKVPKQNNNFAIPNLTDTVSLSSANQVLRRDCAQGR
jgi:hypothetical protein